MIGKCIKWYFYSILTQKSKFTNIRMEIIIEYISNIILVTFILFPFIISYIAYKRKFSLTSFQNILIIGFISILITIFFAWWSYHSDMYLLKYYGYDFDGLGHNEIYGHVASETMHKVKELETSIMGIGWPLKAIFASVFYLPYVFLLIIIIKRLKKKNHNALFKY